MSSLLESTPPTKFFPAFFLDTIDRRATYASEALPHRITLFPPLQEPYDPAYGTALKKVMNPLEPFEVVVGGNDIFGAGKELTPVKRIEDSERLQHLHRLLVQQLGNLMHDQTYRQPYNPHISVKNTEDIEDGRRISIAGFTIVEKAQGGSWVIRDKVGLQGES